MAHQSHDRQPTHQVKLGKITQEEKQLEQKAASYNEQFEKLLKGKYGCKFDLGNKGVAVLYKEDCKVHIRLSDADKTIKQFIFEKGRLKSAEYYASDTNDDGGISLKDKAKKFISEDDRAGMARKIQKIVPCLTQKNFKENMTKAEVNNYLTGGFGF